MNKNTFLLARRISLANTRLMSAWYYFARDRHLNENALSVLYALDDGAAHTQMQLCRDWLMPKTTINTCIRDFAQKKWVKLSPSPKDHREKQIHLTAEGRRVAKTLLRPLYQAEKTTTEETVKQFSDTFVDALEYFAAHICSSLEHERNRSPNQT